MSEPVSPAVVNVLAQTRPWVNGDGPASLEEALAHQKSFGLASRR